MVPLEGTNLWVDYLTVMERSPNKDLAWDFIDFLNEPENAARLALHVRYATPNRAAQALLPKSFLEDPVIYPAPEVLARAEFYRILPPAALKARNLLFSRLMQEP